MKDTSTILKSSVKFENDKGQNACLENNLVSERDGTKRNLTTLRVLDNVVFRDMETFLLPA